MQQLNLYLQYILNGTKMFLKLTVSSSKTDDFPLNLYGMLPMPTWTDTVGMLLV